MKKEWTVTDSMGTVHKVECKMGGFGGNKIRLAVNGVFLDDGTPYEPVSKAPTWVWILVAVSCVGGWFFAGLIGMCIGIIFSIFAVQNALQKKTGLAIGLFAASIVVSVLIFFLVRAALF